MIRVERPESPGVLSDDDGKGKTERTKAIKSLQDHLDRAGDAKEWKFTFSAYKHPDVKAVLKAMFSGKCAYCESSYRGTQPMDVEHWRPKGQTVSAEGSDPVKPAYYWLASTWENLLPSCIDCNRQRNHHDVVENRTVLIGKKNEFPLEDPSVRANEPDTEDRETPLILDPCVDDPKEFLEFDDAGQGVVRPLEATGLNHRRAKASVRVYGLNRVGLVLNRQELAKHVELRIATIKGLSRLLSEHALDDEVVMVIEELMMAEMLELARMRRPDRQFSLLATQLVDRHMSTFADLAGLDDM